MSAMPMRKSRIPRGDGCSSIDVTQTAKKTPDPTNGIRPSWFFRSVGTSTSPMRGAIFTMMKITTTDSRNAFMQ